MGVDPLVDIDLDALTSFVNEQINFHEQLLDTARAQNDERQVLRRTSVIGRYRQICDVIEFSRNHNKTRPQTLRLALSWEEVHDLPPELLAELSVSDGDKLEFQIVQIMEDLGGAASLDRLLVALYRETKEIYQRTWLNNRLYRMAQKEMIFSVPGKKGVYSTELMDKEQAAALL